MKRLFHYSVDFIVLFYRKSIFLKWAKHSKICIMRGTYKAHRLLDVAVIF